MKVRFLLFQDGGRPGQGPCHSPGQRGDHRGRDRSTGRQEWEPSASPGGQRSQGQSKGQRGFDDMYWCRLGSIVILI